MNHNFDNKENESTDSSVSLGVPKFYRFISERYPLINSKVHPKASPRIDNLYLDMNGIIHNCVRASPANGGRDAKRYTSSAPLHRTTEEIFLDVFKYIDNIVSLVPPTRLLYMAIDGVAPRAKMNQQRSRRFRSVKEREEEHQRRLAEDPMYAASNYEPFDSNCITPGTQFMQRLTEALKYFVAKKISEDIRWHGISVILSGAEVPGEGEHKIMEYIRAVRESGTLAPNLRHCVYGLDADLIMLGLVTHEPHFFILREKVDFMEYRRKKGGPRLATALDTAVFGEFEFLSIGVMREYLVYELGSNGNSSLPFFDIERIADDFVFILMLIGNDFLPHLPTLDIASGTLGVMLHLYKRTLPIMGGYLTDEGKICSTRMEYFLAKLSALDKLVLKSKFDSADEANRGRRRSRNQAFQNVDYDTLFGFSNSGGAINAGNTEEDLKRMTAETREKILDEELMHLRRRYYEEKFGVGFCDEHSSGLEELAQSYVEGIWWTLRYYTEGCRHWRWFYPFHYAPLAFDVCGVSSKLAHYEQTTYTRDQPFLPLEQLLSVLPPKSAWCLPKPYQSLMVNPLSPIRSFYPEDFKLDMNGKRNDWEAVVLLPFVDETQLRRAISSIPSEDLTDVEKKRNSHGEALLCRHDLGWKEDIHPPFQGHLLGFTSNAKMADLQLPKIPEGKAFGAKGLKQHFPPSTFPEDLPRLGKHHFTPKLQAVGVNIFGFTSRSESLVLELRQESNNLENGTPVTSSSSVTPAGVGGTERILPGSPIWFGFPWRNCGFVDQIVTASLTYKRHSGKIRGSMPQVPTGVDVRSTTKSNFERDRNILASNLMQKCAVSINPPSEIITVEVVGQIAKDNVKSESAILCHPLFVVAREVAGSAEEQPNAVMNCPSPGSPVLYIGSGAFFGHRGVVKKNLSTGMVEVEFKISAPAAREPAFGYRVVSHSSKRWLSLSKLASEVGLKPSLADYVLGSVRVRLSSGNEEIDLGLGIKYIARALYVPGYARPDERAHYSFSQDTIELMKKYRNTFPHLFSALSNLRTHGNNGGGRGEAVYNSRDLFGSNGKADDAVRAVSTWLSLQGVSDLPLVKSTSSALSRETVAELERHASIAMSLQRDFNNHLETTSLSKRIKEVPSKSLVTGDEDLIWRLDGKSQQGITPISPDGSGLRLGDRVVNRMGVGGVPFGLRGTVVGIHPSSVNVGASSSHSTTGMTTVEVVFDEGFIAGSSLNGRCSTGRGKAVPAASLYILRPDRDNDYYVRNYARIAAQTGSAIKREGKDKAEKISRKEEVEQASLLSYSAVVMKSLSSKNSQRPKTVSGVASGSLLARPTAATTLPSLHSAKNGPTPTKYAPAQVEGVDPKSIPLPSFAKGRLLRPAGSLRNRLPDVSRNTNSSTGIVRKDQRQTGLKAATRPMNSTSKNIERDTKKLAELLKKDLGISGEQENGSGDNENAEGNTSTSMHLHDISNEEDEFASAWAQLQSEAKSRSSDKL